VNCGGAGRIEIAFRSRASLVPGLEESAEAPCSCLGFFFCVCVLRPRFCWMFCDANQEESRQSIVNSFALLPLFYFYFLCVAFYFFDKGTKVYRVVLFILFLFLRMKNKKTKNKIRLLHFQSHRQLHRLRQIFDT
jgi:apolipoprotein N-acyltransferase